ncbi:phage portal protein [Bacillus spizizenii]|nr:phage portal protein [Bacillus spizizenii]MCY9427707.1 phage portal protein [Bacillus spizizenii]MCY9431078.1 phage portal protein [Bacillus spizizenii]
MIEPKRIKRAVEKYYQELPRYKKLQDYYLGKSDILKRIIPDPDKPNNKIVTGYASQIVDIVVGYFAAIPLTYISKTNNEKFLTVLKKIFYNNDEEDLNAEIVKNFTIFGKTYELFTGNTGNDLTITHYNPLEMYVERDSKKRPLFAIRPWKEEDSDGNTVTHVEVYDDKEIFYYKSENNTDFMLNELEKVEKHFFGDVPVSVYSNNDEEQGDFEKWVPLIDNIEQMLSDNANEIEAWVNAYLVLAAHQGTESDDIVKLKHEQVLLPENVDDVKWLTKDTNVEFQKNFFEVVDNLLHDQSGTPKLTSEKFASNLSGQALGFKLFSLESKSKIKERKMQKALRKRIKFICNILNLPRKVMKIPLPNIQSYDPSDIDFNFVRNVPQNKSEVTDQMVKFASFLDLKTLLSMSPDIADPDAVINRVKEYGTAMNPTTISENTIKDENPNKKEALLKTE